MGGATRFLMLLTTATPSPLLQHRYPTLLRLARHRQGHRVLLSMSYHHLLSSPLSFCLPFPLKIKSSQQLHTRTTSAHFTDSSHPASSPPFSHPWPEWSNFLLNLSATGYFNRQGFGIETEEFFSVAELPEDFLCAATACLAFARDRPDILGMLSRRDIEVVVENGMPFLFKNGGDSVRRMKLFLGTSYSNVLDTDRAQHMVDLMKFLLSYASNLVSSEKNNLHNRELLESSVRNLFGSLAQLGHGALESNVSGSVQNQLQDKYGQTRRPIGQNIEMKRGDWICPRCSFMNFARNVKCLECEETRPKRQLAGGEWECPQCDFFNYGRNMVCLRCDCKRPGEFSLGTANFNSGSYVNKADIDSRLAANEEKAQRWFNKISQMDGTSDMNAAIADEDFPEIMPLRKGVNRFVVSTRKTPLERRLANTQYQRNLGNNGTLEGKDFQNAGVNMTSNQTINRSLDEILSRKPAASETNDSTISSEQNDGTNVQSFVSNSSSSQHGEQIAAVSGTSNNVNLGNTCQASGKPMEPIMSKDTENELAEKSERWFKRVAELHNVTDVANAISDEDFPEIMPMRKGENRFVVSKRKDRSLTSPMYKRRMAMEQANSTNHVPFVPFPPNYFAKKDNQWQDGADSTNTPVSEPSKSATPENLSDKLNDSMSSIPNAAHVQGMETQQYNTGTWSSRSSIPSGESSSEIRPGAGYGVATSGNSTQHVTEPPHTGHDGWRNGNASLGSTPYMTGNSVQNSTKPEISNNNDSGSCSYSPKENTNETKNLTQTTPQSSENQNNQNSWVGKSLEGSLVKEEPDPLDMSEEAKAERWFRRVAQIKDISELSQIPDEDFPSIMPMRKGVNRFVVSKRKTPLERRLTSTQYRKNLPTVTSDPVKENDS